MTVADEDLVERANARVGALLKGKYTLDRVLGIGGMATVYAATHRNGKEFAVKVLHADLSMRTDTRTRFLREGYLANRVNHPGAVAVLDDDIAEDGGAFLVMELLHGQTVESLWEAQRGRLPLPMVAGIGLQLLDVLTAAHARGLIHRDIKPGNLMLTTDGQVKVLDFGIARLRDMAGAHTTQTGMVMGTPAFMAPEHAMAKTDEIDAQTDVWAAGATMFTLATGQLVHEAENTQMLLIRAATTPARKITTLLPSIPPELAEVIDGALAFDKKARWATATAMQTALREAAREAFQTVPTAGVLAEMFQGLGQRAKARANAPTEESIEPASPQTPVLKPIVDSGEIPTNLRAAAPRPVPVAPMGTGPDSPPAVAMITAAAVATDSSLRRTVSRPRPIVAAGLGAAGLVVAIVLLVANRSSSSRDAPTVGSATRATAAVAPSMPPSSLPSIATTSDWVPVAPTNVPHASEPAPPVAPPPVAPVRNASPPAPAVPHVRPVASAAPAPATAAPKNNCNPPYEFDENGNKRWKRECL